MVSHVEEEMGVKFIDRSQRPIALLPAGELFYLGCRRIVDQFEGSPKRVARLRFFGVGSDQCSVDLFGWSQSHELVCTTVLVGLT